MKPNLSSNNSSKKRGGKSMLRLAIRPVVRLRIAAASIVILLTTGFILLFNFTGKKNLHAASNGDYRSIGTGNWNNVATWEKYNGTSWAAASTAPTNADGLIEILSGDTVTVNASVSADQVVVDATGQLNISAGTLTVSNGTGIDLTVNGSLVITSAISLAGNSAMSVSGTGVLKSTGVLTSAAGSTVKVETGGRFKQNGGSLPTASGTWNVNYGGTYEHAMDGGIVPSATWNSGSKCEITGASLSVPVGLSQTFQNFTWDCVNQTGSLNFASTLQTIQADFIVNSTGSGAIYLDMQGNNSTLNVGGNLYIEGGNTYICVNGKSTINAARNVYVDGGSINFNQAGGSAYGNTSAIFNISGNLFVSGGVIDLSQYSGINNLKGRGIINLMGDLNLSGPGIITETGNSRGQIYFTGNNTVQVFTSNRFIANTIDFTINNFALVRTDTNVFTGNGDFVLLAGGGLLIGSPDGITKSSLLGNVQSTGTRAYNTGADYTYEGRSAQITGDGLPSVVRTLILNNPNNCTLTASCSVSSTLFFTNGIFIALIDTLTLGTSTVNTGSLFRLNGHVNGYLQRWIAASANSNILFPVGSMTSYNAANFSFTTAPSAGSIVSRFIVAAPGSNGLPITDAGDICNTIAERYWTFGGINGFSGGVYNVNLNCDSFPRVYDYTRLHLFRRISGATAWTANGTHAAGTGSNVNPIANRTGMNALGQYGVTSSYYVNPLPLKLISFDARPEKQTVKLCWTTSSEINNDYFTVERSADGIQFVDVLRKQGSGNSNTLLYYYCNDENPIKGYSYYRLRQTDYDGRYSYSGIIKVKFKLNDENKPAFIILSANPNPFSEKLKINFISRLSDRINIFIINSSGQTVFKDEIQAEEGINYYDYADKNNLRGGIYFINLIYNNQFVSQKVIKK